MHCSGGEHCGTQARAGGVTASGALRDRGQQGSCSLSQTVPPPQEPAALPALRALRDSSPPWDPEHQDGLDMLGRAGSHEGTAGWSPTPPVTFFTPPMTFFSMQLLETSR